METKCICPHCGKTLHEQPYLMNRDPNREYVLTRLQRWVALYFICFLILVGGFAILARHLH